MFKLLIVDDEFLEREALKQIITKHFGHEVDIRVAENGQSAIEVACLWNTDLIIMDIEMPGINGLEATRTIKEQLPNCKVIFLTAYSVFQYAQEAVKLGVEDFILKPATDEEIITAMQKTLKSIKIKVESKEPIKVKNTTAKDKTSKILEQVDDYLHKNYMHDISLDSVATSINFNPFYFSKLFKQYFSTNFVDYLTDIRIDVAKSLLKDPTKTSKEVGVMVGYTDPNYFTKIFKKKTGLTPTCYRNSV